jgi:hypothetical protein
VNFDFLFDFVPDQLTELLLDFFFYDENDGFKPGIDCVIQRKFNDRLPVFTDRGQLLEAAETTSDPGSHDDQYRFFHICPPSLSALCRQVCTLSYYNTSD